MNDLDRALGDISSIRRQLARTTEFRGYGPATLATTGLLAFAAAAVQMLWVPDPSHRITQYLGVWVTTAVLSAVLAGTQMFTRSRRLHSGMSDEMIHMAVEQFLPAVGAGFLLMIVLWQAVPGSIWILPGMWQVIFSLGIFSSCRFLPRPIMAAGGWYLLTGMLSIGLGGPEALSPWVMGIPFGVGQLLVAGILLFATPEASNES